MEHEEYEEMYEKLTAYTDGVSRRAQAWVAEVRPDLTVDNTGADPDAYTISLSGKVTVSGGRFMVWLMHHTEPTVLLYAPESLLGIHPE